MSKFKSFLALLLLLVTGSIHADDNISVASVTLTPGEVSDVIINCEFTSENITLYQFDLYLPDGVTLAKNAKGRYAAGTTYVLSDRHDEHIVSIGENSGYCRIIVYSNSNYTIEPGSGELLRLKVLADNSVSGTLNGSIKKFSMFETDQAEHAMADVNFEMTSSTMAIGEVKTEAGPDAAGNAPIYDLMGRRLQQKPASGYYIQGGKKFFVK
jgi:hypothetical protein